MTKNFLQIDVTKDYPEFRLTANLTVGEGEFFSLVGPSGCGKTTLLRLISGLVQPDQGRIVLDGRDLTTVPVADRRIGFVFQDYALFPHLTVGENIEYGLKVRRLPAARRRERVQAMLSVFEITALADRRVQELSGGERQRVALARALAPEPLLLLLDEPFAALDYSLRRRLRRELKELQIKLGFTVIFVTHQQEEALALSERLAVMQAGRILQVGTATEVYTSPAHPFVATFLGDANLIPCNALPTAEGLLIRPRDGQEFIIPAAENQGNDAGETEKTGGCYYLMVRPEDVILETETPIYRGTITTWEYLGYASYAEVKTDHGLTIKVLTGKETRYALGARVGFSFRRTALKLLPINEHPSS
ncbi:MAG TPA: ABC transporter ATP-binding protein [Firmicutes bacterium]|uniref:ABC-type quaternary amine transporter n=1 Tax=Capillibacterium thermochitinicola TaxID=2699427 RepID=A0A8J6LSZ9_9FIRM|nr:ABC transporter ATP-binding protein [Capillibacterium thermochitinicola]MBA2133757.1 ABC transporter ATP-binding protein [Capillibacterium thermochitinicola]HHW12172.1 ABC transporter ATP-binding protein [Bacillota bacterium]